jgi:hypothetical protein
MWGSSACDHRNAVPDGCRMTYHMGDQAHSEDSAPVIIVQIGSSRSEGTTDHHSTGKTTRRPTTGSSSLRRATTPNGASRATASRQRPLRASDASHREAPAPRIGLRSAEFRIAPDRAKVGYRRREASRAALPSAALASPGTCGNGDSDRPRPPNREQSRGLRYRCPTGAERSQPHEPGAHRHGAMNSRTWRRRRWQIRRRVSPRLGRRRFSQSATSG